MFEPKYKEIIFYVYSFEKFNIIFIIKTLLKYNKLNNSEDYKLEIIYKNVLL